ncbi:MAG TPA: DUF401 family protein [Clostridia bacterium]|nr:DUF401 family protein [Clostridia bacterium]
MLIVFKLVGALALMIWTLNRRRNFGLAMLAGSLSLALFSNFSWEDTARIFVERLTDLSTIQLMAVVVLINLMGYVMKKTGSLEKLVDSMLEVLKDTRLVLMAIPAVIGMLPVTGGAMMSAPLVVEAGDKMGLSAERQAAANVLFRHLLCAVFPLYPALILARDLSGLDMSILAKAQVLPVAVGFVFGFFFIFRGSKPEKPVERQGINTWHSLGRVFHYSSPILLAVILVMSIRINFVLAVGLAVILALTIDSKNFHQVLVRSREYILPGIDWNMGIAVAGIMVFQGFVQATGAVDYLAVYFKEAGTPLFLLAIIFSLFTGMVTGSSLATIGILFPLFSPLVPGGLEREALFSLLYISVVVGYMVSPIHLCLVLTKEICQARFNRIYVYLVPPLVATLLTGILLAVMKS